MVTSTLKDNLTPDEFEIYTKLLVITLWKGGYPHEIIVCMFNKCFEEVVEVEAEGKDSQKREKKKMWPPRRILEELSDISLREL